MYTLVFKCKTDKGVVFDVYYTDEQRKQRIVGNIYSYWKYGFDVVKYVKVDGVYHDIVNLHTLAKSEEYKIPEDVLRKLYAKAKQITETIWSYI